MPPMFLSKIFVESQDSRFDVVEAWHEENVPTMVEQIKHFSKNFDDL